MGACFVGGCRMGTLLLDILILLRGNTMTHTKTVLTVLCFFVLGGIAYGQVAPPRPIADFEDGDQLWVTEEHAVGLLWTDEDTAGEASAGSISIFIDPSQPDDDSPESKVRGPIPEGINMADYEYISFYYKCNGPAYTGNTMFVMPMNGGGAAGAGASNTGTMIGDGEWHYEEYHRDDFTPWWGEYDWDTVDTIVLGVWNTNENGEAEVWYDHVMVSNEPGGGILLAAGGPPLVNSTIPANGSAVSSLDEVVVNFNQTVSGVVAGDLLVNGAAATDVSTPNDRSYTFTGFPQPSGDSASIEVQPGSIVSSTNDPFAGFSFDVELFTAVEYSAPFASVAPTLDGVIEDGEYPGDFVSDWKPNLGAQDIENDGDMSPEWTATHDADYYYVAYRTRDDVRNWSENPDSPWEHDNVEFFIDGPNLKEGTGAQFRVNWNGSEWVSSANENWEFAVSEDGTDWSVEARFAKSDHTIPTTGTIGFNSQPTDNDDGTRGTYFFWTDSPNNDNPWNDASSWGNVILMEGDTVGVQMWSLY